jgi:hypothetical protein
VLRLLQGPVGYQVCIAGLGAAAGWLYSVCLFCEGRHAIQRRVVPQAPISQGARRCLK